MLCRRVEPFQGKLATHPIYSRVRNLRGLQIFMTNHVFAVWDFMTLTKTLQQRLTCISTPWLPPEHPAAARLINEIVLGEETDEVRHGEFLSHYVLYIRAMGEIGADPGPMKEFEAALRAGTSPADALAPLDIAQSTKDFVLHTLATAKLSTPQVAASLLLAREDLIPTMFERVVKEMDARSTSGVRAARALRNRRDHLADWARRLVPGSLRAAADQFEESNPDPRAFFRIYLERHIELDGDQHGPMAQRLLQDLCGDDDALWEEATASARDALRARVALWDGVLQSIEEQAHGADGFRMDGVGTPQSGLFRKS
ncbi:MAG: DUF3050 domain-containing protein [Deltaproteobacteria bacterium]|nr:DUF3050 domain-containing protein [Deltaproteobacteria bacterium]